MMTDPNGASLDGKKGVAATRTLGRTDLRAENTRLRKLLARAEDIAARYAIMLREGDHRIKNSLQIVSSLMSIQAGSDETGSVATALRTAAARVQSIARIHDALQAGGGEDSLDLGVAISTMCEALHAMAGDPRGVMVRVTAEPLHAPVAFAQPVVLAVNELVVNSLRHAFPDHQKGVILVAVVRTAEEVRITVSDDGVGLPDGYAQGKGYGMKLVRMMTHQIGGVLHVHSTRGAQFMITAPYPLNADRS